MTLGITQYVPLMRGKIANHAGMELMQLRQIAFIIWLCIIALPAVAIASDDTGAITAATNDLRRIPSSTIIPPLRLESSVKRDQILCLALAMYHEARGETEAERVAVAQVIYNRAVHTDSTVCGVVWADKGSQFQWVKASSTIVPRELSAWDSVQNIAVRFARNRPLDGTHGATNFYNPALCSPNWADAGRVTVSMRQVFVRLDGKYSHFAGKPSETDPISQLDRLGRLRPTRSYGGGRS
jgi:N-acetylmuramoyl-L-alanine amidase